MCTPFHVPPTALKTFVFPKDLGFPVSLHKELYFSN